MIIKQIIKGMERKGERTMKEAHYEE